MPQALNLPVSKTVFSSAARTTHTASNVLYSDGARGIRFDLNISAFTGTSITFTVQFYDFAAATWRTLLASAALSATGAVVLQITPDLAASANLIAQAILPERIRVLPSGTITSVTYSMGATWQRS